MFVLNGVFSPTSSVDEEWIPSIPNLRLPWGSHVKRASLDVLFPASNSRIKSFYWKCSCKGAFQMTSDPQPSLSIFQWKNNHAVECQKSKVAGALKSTGKTSEQPRRFQEVCPKMALDFFWRFLWIWRQKKSDRFLLTKPLQFTKKAQIRHTKKS